MHLHRQLTALKAADGEGLSRLATAAFFQHDGWQLGRLQRVNRINKDTPCSHGAACCQHAVQSIKDLLLCMGHGAYCRSCKVLMPVPSGWCSTML